MTIVDIKDKLYKANIQMLNVDDRSFDAWQCHSFLQSVTEGASDEQMNALHGCFVGDCNSINKVVLRWSAEGLLPQNRFKLAYDEYIAHNQNKALYLILSSFSYVSERRVLCTEETSLSESVVAKYTRFIPEYVLMELVERCLFDPNLGKSTLLSTYKNIGDWFAYCAKQGWLSFEPYVYRCDDNGIPVLVLKYNRVIFFSDRHWGIYTSISENSYWYKGEDLPMSLLEVNSPNFVSALFWAGLVSVGCRMTEFTRLIETNKPVIDEFVSATANVLGITIHDSYIQILSDCLTVTEDVHQMNYRLVKDAAGDYARIGITGKWTGAFEVPCGICPKTVEYNFSWLFNKGAHIRYLHDKIITHNVYNTLLCGILALAGIMLDDKSVYAMDRESYLRSGYSDELIPVLTVNDLPRYAN